MPKTRGKHKRGARGSTEEGNSVPKRANMAASKDPEDITSGDEESETKDEPTRAELKSMLVDIRSAYQVSCWRINKLEKK